MKPTFTLLTLLFFFQVAFSQSFTDAEKNTIAEEVLREHIEHLKTHPHDHSHGHPHPELPEEATLHHTEINGKEITIFLNLPFDYLNNQYDDSHFEEIYLTFFNALPQNLDLKKFALRAQNEQGNFVPLESYTHEPPRTFPRFPDNGDGAPEIIGSNERSYPHTSQTHSSGSLSGKTVWLSPGHGWLYYTSTGGFTTQRGETNDMVEDFGSVEGINYYLLNYLINAGANVWMVRERDVNENEVIVDNSEPGYAETGTWTTTSNTGYDPATGQVNGANGYRYASTTTGGATSTATWTPTIPAKGWYWVSVLYKAFSDRTSDARYEVTHAGGTTTVSINQEVHGETWVYLGRFYFEAGAAGNVKLINSSADGSQVVIADAVRFGGGNNGAAGSARSILDCSEGTGPTYKPRFEECARMYAPYQNYPTCRSDVTIRPHYAEWELAKGTAQEQANAVYISWHTNAFNGSARGTVTYAHDTDPTPGSYDLQGFVQSELINNIKGCWDNSWQDRGTNTANFGEVRELSTMPGCLVEVAFHDNAQDAEALTTPYFRNLAARGIYQGIVKFFNDRDGSPATYLPEPPTHLSAVNSATGSITLNWNAPSGADCGGADAASGYRVYLSTHGRGFQDGIAVSGTSYTFTGLNPSTTYYFRVSATNAGGESFPTATVAARTPATGFAVPFLIVDGFDRLDRAGAVRKTSSAVLTDLRRLFIERMNSYDYMVEHAQAFEGCDVSFDGASNEAVIQGDVTLTNYVGIDWYTGEESTVDRSLDGTEQTLLQTYLTSGGHLIISGAEIGWDIGRAGSANANLTFYNNYLKATYLGDDSGSYNFAGVGGDIYDGVSGQFDDNTVCYFDAEYPDRLGTSGGSAVVVNYSGGTGDGAGVAFDGAFGVVYFGFPIESVLDATTKSDLICNAVSFMTPEILAAEGMELQGEVKGKENQLTWTTLMETSTDRFELESSADGFNYKKITTVKAAGESLEKRAYTFTDKNPNRKTYYRLKLYDFDGSYEYSNVIVLEQGGVLVEIYPNPMKTDVHFEFDVDKKINMTILLLDINGREMLRESWEQMPGERKTLDVSGLPIGVYQYLIETPGQMEGGKLIKTK